MSTNDKPRSLAEILVGAGLPNFTVVRLNPDQNEESDKLRYHWCLMVGDVNIAGEYACGSAIPLMAFTRGGQWPWSGVKPRGSLGSPLSPNDPDLRPHLGRVCLEASEKREAVRRVYLPPLVDIVAAVLLDYSSARQHVDGWGWAEEFGYTDIAGVKRLVLAHPTAIHHGQQLARWLGGALEEAVEAAGDW